MLAILFRPWCITMDAHKVFPRILADDSLIMATVLGNDPKGDRLDAVLCLMQAAWAQRQREQGDTRWGLPADMDPVEGWILSA